MLIPERIQWHACDIRPLLPDESRPCILDENGHPVQRLVARTLLQVSFLCEQVHLYANRNSVGHLSMLVSQ